MDLQKEEVVHLGLLGAELLLEKDRTLRRPNLEMEAIWMRGGAPLSGQELGFADIQGDD
jgi:hypothetical protein